MIKYLVLLIKKKKSGRIKKKKSYLMSNKWLTSLNYLADIDRFGSSLSSVTRIGVHMVHFIY